MRRFLFSSFLILLTTPAIIFAQRDSMRSVFLNAESWFLFEEYSEALPLYESIYKTDPGNDNLNYKMGICLLNDPYQKDKAIQYLLDASKNINPEYKDGSFKERTAPPDALYYLGNAYLVNELLNQAIESYEEFLKVMDHDVYDEELVNAQIRSCKNAQRLKTMPVDIDLTLIDPIINTRYSDINPVVSGDGTKLAFVTELPFYDGAFYTERTEEGWSYPQITTQMLGFDEDVYPVALSYDGTEMILYYDDDYIGNLYYSKMENGLWSPAIKMDQNISTKYWESHASFSKDGRSLYFTSNRKGSHGGLDIYLSDLQDDGSWGPPVNLGTTINSRYNEECPVISEDGQTLYFSSYGHYNMGGYDIFYSKKGEDGSWGIPVNIGYPINTTDDDLFFQPINDGNGAYYSVYSPSGIGRHDIYYMNIYSVNNPRLYAVSGNFRTEDGWVDSTRMAIYVIDIESGDTLMITPPTAEGNFSFQLKKGLYGLHFKAEGHQDLIRPLHISDSSNKTGILFEDPFELELIEREVLVFEGEESEIEVNEAQYVGVAGVPLSVPVKAPKGSTVLVRTFQDSMLISTDTLVMEKRRVDLELVPLPGKSEVEMEMIDEDGNLHRSRIEISGTRPVTKEKAMPVEEQLLIEPVQPIPKDPLGIILVQSKRNSTGPLHDQLVKLNPEEQEITNQRELFEHLYEENASKEYSPDDVDVLLGEVISGGDAAILQEKLLANSDGKLKEYLKQLDTEAEGIQTSEELLKHLKENAVSQGYEVDDVRKAMLHTLDEGDDMQKADQQTFSKEEVDALLAGEVGEGKAGLLKQQMLEHTDGALKEYLDQLDLEAEGIQSNEDMLRHLEEAAAVEEFSMEDVRKAMFVSLDEGLEVERIYEELLLTTEGVIKEILESLKLRDEGIYTIDELMDRFSLELEERGYGKKEIDQILLHTFGDSYDSAAGNSERTGMPLWLILGAALILGATIIWFIIIWRKRSEKDENGEN